MGTEDYNPPLWFNPTNFGEGRGVIQDALMAAPRTPDGVRVYRALNKDVLDAALAKSKDGTTFVLDGFQSTSIDPGVAYEFFDLAVEDNVFLEIIPKRGAYTADLMAGDTPAEQWLLSQQEFALPSGRTYHLVGTRRADIMYEGVKVRATIYQIEMLDDLPMVVPPPPRLFRADVDRVFGKTVKNEMIVGYKKWGEDLSEVEASMAELYNTKPSAFNPRLWADPTDFSDEALILQNMLLRSPDKYPPVVWRGSAELKEYLDVDNLVEGETYVFRGFQSTSIDPNIANAFSGAADAPIIEILSPTAGAFINVRMPNMLTNEFTLPSNMRFRFRGRKTVEYDFGPDVGVMTREALQFEMLPVGMTPETLALLADKAQKAVATIEKKAAVETIEIWGGLKPYPDATDVNKKAYELINETLRSGKETALTKQMDKAFATLSRRTTEESIVVRGFRLDDLIGTEPFAEFVGMQFVDPGYVSVTPEANIRFAQWMSDLAVTQKGGGRPAIMRLNLPTGSVLIRMDDFAKDVNELVMGRGGAFRVTAYGGVDDQGNLLFEAEILPERFPTAKRDYEPAVKSRLLNNQDKDGWEDGLTKDQRTKVRSYTHDAERYNDRLHKDPTDFGPHGLVLQDLLLSAPPLPVNTTVWRGVSNSALEKVFGPNPKAGDIVRITGFQSGTIKPRTALNFPVERSGADVVLEIIPLRGMYVERLSSNPLEKEVLLPANGNFRLVAVTEAELGMSLLGRGDDVLTVLPSVTKTVWQIEEIPEAPPAAVTTGLVPSHPDFPVDIRRLNAALEEEIRAIPDPWKNSLGIQTTEQENAALVLFRADGGAKMNARLRKDPTDFGQDGALLQLLLRKAPRPPMGVIVYRGMSTPASVKMLPDLAVGKEYVFDGFNSASTNPVVAAIQAYTKTKPGQIDAGVILEIRPKSGAFISRQKLVVKGGKTIEGSEFLPPSATGYRVVGIRRDAEFDLKGLTAKPNVEIRTVVQLEEIDPADAYGFSKVARTFDDETLDAQLAAATKWQSDQPLTLREREAFIAYKTGELPTESMALLDDPTNFSPEAALIQRALLRATPPEGAIVWRGIRASTAKRLRIDGLVVGKTYTLGGFQSATINPRVAVEFSDQAGDSRGKGVIIEIRTKSGVYVETIEIGDVDPSWQEMYAEILAEAEHEFLIPSGIRAKLVAVKDVEYHIVGETNEIRQTLQFVEVGAPVFPPAPPAPEVPAPPDGFVQPYVASEEAVTRADDAMAVAHDSWRDPDTSPLTKLEQKALLRYTDLYTDHEGKFNAPLWADPTDFRGMRGALQSGLLKAPPIPEGTVVYRGIDAETAKKIIGDATVGDVVTLRGFQSTSLDPQKSLEFASEQPGGIVLVIKPRRGGYVDSMTLEKVNDVTPTGEFELLLPANGDFSLVAVKKSTFEIRDPSGSMVVESHPTILLEEVVDTAAPTPQAPTPAVTKPPDALDVTDWRKIGGQQGSNPGGLYDAPDGQKYYVKWPLTEAHARNEHLAAVLYRELGIAVPDVILVTDASGRIGVASKIIDGLQNVGEGIALADGVAEGFVVDAWLANWDVVGLDYDNLLLKAGKAYRIDTGGALVYRAQGEPKGAAFGTDVTELEVLRDADRNYQAASVFGDLDESLVRQGAVRVLTMTDDRIKRLVDQYGPGTDVEKAVLTVKLIGRREYIRRTFFPPVVPPPVPPAPVPPAPVPSAVVSFGPGDPLEKLVKDKGEFWRNDLDNATSKAISSYTSGSSYNINSPLWADPTAFSDEALLIQRALLDAPPPPAGLRVWRGVTATNPQIKAILDDPTVGTIFQLDGFQSTSLSPGIATTVVRATERSLMYNEAFPSALFEIVPATGAYVTPLSPKFYAHQKEFLLASGQNYRLVEVKDMDFSIDVSDWDPLLVDYLSGPGFVRDGNVITYRRQVFTAEQLPPSVLPPTGETELFDRALEAKIREQQLDWSVGLPVDKEKAFMAYSVDSESWNKLLWLDADDFGPDAAAMQRAIISAPRLPDGTKVWRGISQNGLADVFFDKPPVVGNLYPMRGFQSTSLDPARAIEYADAQEYGVEGAILEIRNARQGAYLPQLIDELAGSDRDLEMVLPANVGLRFVGTRQARLSTSPLTDDGVVVGKATSAVRSVHTFDWVDDAVAPPPVVPPPPPVPPIQPAAPQPPGPFSAGIVKHNPEDDIALRDTAWERSLSAEEMEAVDSYSVFPSLLNDKLRAVPNVFDEEASILQNALLSAPAPAEGITVLRGVSKWAADEILKGKKVGDIIVLDGFQSATTDPSVMRIFAPRDEDVVFEILPNKGAYVAKIVSELLASQKEFLMPSGRQYEIVRIKTGTFRGKSAVAEAGQMSDAQRLEYGSDFERTLYQIRMMADDEPGAALAFPPVASRYDSAVDAAFSSGQQQSNWAFSLLTDGERDAFARYGGGQSFDMNLRLRKDPTDFTDTAALIYNGLLKAPRPPVGLVVWRGIKKSTREAILKDSKVGDIIVLDGFQSTSIDPLVAQFYSFNPQDTILEIAPNSGAFIRGLTGDSKRYEMEFLLLPGRRYRIFSIDDGEFVGSTGKAYRRDRVRLTMLDDDLPATLPTPPPPVVPPPPVAPDAVVAEIERIAKADETIINLGGGWTGATEGILADKSDQGLKRFRDAVRGDQTMQVVDGDTFDKMSGTLVFRGLHDKAFLATNLSGEWVGRGVDGNGNYFGTLDEAATFAGGDEPYIFAAKIKEGAKVVYAPDVKDAIDEWAGKAGEKAIGPFDLDPSRFAIYRLEADVVKHQAHMMGTAVLDNSAIVVDARSLPGGSRSPSPELFRTGKET